MQAKDHLAIAAPPGRDLAEWLSTYDATPVVLPEWPESLAMAVVSVTEVDGGTLLGHVLLTRDALGKTSTSVHLNARRLFFTVPRSFLLAEGVCEGLNRSSWVDDAEA